MSSELLLIDISGIFWANWHATADQGVSEAFERTIAKVAQLRTGFDLVAVCCDVGPYFRKEISAEYKAQRDAPPPQAVEQFDRVKRRLEADGLLLWGVKGFEADDVIATAVGHAKANSLRVTIASGDKDLLALVDDAAGIRCLSPISGVCYDREQTINKFGVSPDMVPDLLALAGDASDNIPGVPGVGIKTAAKLLLEFGTLNDIWPALDTMKPGKLREALVDHASSAVLSRKLVALRTDVPIDFNEIYQERKVQKLADTTQFQDVDDGDASIDEPDSAPRAKAPSQPPPAQQAIELHEERLAAVTGPQDWSLALEPRTLGAAYKLAKGLFESRLYSRFANAEAIWSVIIRGREMGMGALLALDSMHVVEGRPVLHAHLIVARAKADPDCEYFSFVGGDATYAEYETKNRCNPKPTRLRYTIDQAKTAGLCPDSPRVRPPVGDKDRRGNWEKRPEEMLRKTAAIQLARIEYPQAALGMYAIEEFSEVA